MSHSLKLEKILEEGKEYEKGASRDKHPFRLRKGPRKEIQDMIDHGNLAFFDSLSTAQKERMKKLIAEGDESTIELALDAFILDILNSRSDTDKVLKVK